MIPWLQIEEQIERYADHRIELQKLYEAQLCHYLSTLSNTLATDWEQWKERIAAADIAHLIPDFNESPANVYPVAPEPTTPIVMATDGSQIYPSRHQIESVALIHISEICIDYKRYTEEPLLSSKANLLLPDELPKIEGAERQPSFEERVSDLRTIEELRILADIVDDVAQQKSKAGTPKIALVDGSLILWQLAGRSFGGYDATITEQYLSSFDRFRLAQVPLVGYISRSGSREVIQLLCFIEEQSSSPTTTDQSAIPYTDTSLFYRILQEGQRSILFTSRSKILDNYGDHRVSYFYLHVGDEIAKVEIPAWVAQQPQVVDEVASQCYWQAQLGQGYPIVLSEAHEMAVIRGPDRDLFFAMLEEALIKRGMSPSSSAKQLRKRTPLV